MDLIERAIFFAIGGGVGFILGFIVARLREIKEELDDVDQCVKKCRLEHEHLPRRVKDDRGTFSVPSWQTLAVLVVVLLSAFASFVSQKSANDVKQNQEDLAKVAFCNQQYLKAQAEFLQIYLEVPPASEQAEQQALMEYVEVLDTYIEATKVDGDPMVDDDNVTALELSECIQQAEEKQSE